MIKFVLAAVWISAVTVISVMFAVQNGPEDVTDDAEPSYFGGLDYVTTRVISIPVLHGNQVYGYFLARLVYTAESNKLRTMIMPPEAIIADEVHSYLFANPEIDFSRKDEIDLDALRTGIRDSVNQRVGQKLIHDVLVDQVDFLTKAELRNSAQRGWVDPSL